MPRKLFETGDYGVTNTVYQEGADIVSVQRQPDADRVAESAARKRNRSARKSDFMRPAAEIPHIVQERLKRTNPDVARGDRKAMEKWLNSSEGKPFRTTPKGSSRSSIFMGRSHYNGR